MGRNPTPDGAVDDAMNVGTGFVCVPGSVVVKSAPLVLLEQHEPLENALKVTSGCDQVFLDGGMR